MSIYPGRRRSERTSDPLSSLNLHDLWAGHCPLLGRALYVWVQGCPRRCAGCFNVATLDEDKTGRELTPLEVAQLCIQNGDALVLSGGEPFSQAAALAEACQAIRASRSGTEILVYSGYQLEELLTGRTPAWLDLLAVVDVLIDGPFVKERPSNHPLIGSDNQRIWCLSGRVGSARIASLRTPQVAVELSEDRRLRLVGTGSTGGDMHAVLRTLRRNGLRLGDGRA